MDVLSTLAANGRLVDVAIAVMLLEAATLALYRLRFGEGVPLASLAGNLAAGLSLLLALRVALTGAPAYWIALFLTLSLAAHVWDLASRWRS